MALTARHMVTFKKLKIILFILSISFSSNLYAEKFASIIIDDLGNNFENGQAVIDLPYNLTFAILPKTTYAKDLARLATKYKREVMLHLPLQSVEHHQHSPGTLDLHMTRTEFINQLQLNLSSVPYVRGVNNHMGSLLTRHPGHMAWLMDELARHGGLYFIDSKTTSKSVADQIAAEYNIPNLSRDYFLDPDGDEDTMKKQFNLFIEKVNNRGYALAIAHPYPSSTTFLKNNLHKLKQHGITLVPVSKLIRTANTLNKTRDENNVACTSPACSGL